MGCSKSIYIIRLKKVLKISQKVLEYSLQKLSSLNELCNSYHFNRLLILELSCNIRNRLINKLHQSSSSLLRPLLRFYFLASYLALFYSNAFCIIFSQYSEKLIFYSSPVYNNCFQSLGNKEYISSLRRSLLPAPSLLYLMVLTYNNSRVSSIVMKYLSCLSNIKNSTQH